MELPPAAFFKSCHNKLRHVSHPSVALTSNARVGRVHVDHLHDPVHVDHMHDHVHVGHVHFERKRVDQDRNVRVQNGSVLQTHMCSQCRMDGSGRFSLVTADA